MDPSPDIADPDSAGRWETWRQRARESVLDVNDGIVSAAGIAEGIASAGAGPNVLLLAGVVTILAGGSAAGGAKYTEVLTEWEMNRDLIRAEREAIEADPDGEFEELVGLYQQKGLDEDLARRVAQTLTEKDPVAAHCDAELRLELSDQGSGAVTAGLVAAACYGGGAAIPLLSMLLLPIGGRVELTFLVVMVALALTGVFAAWLTDLPKVRLVVRNLVLGVATMAISLAAGLLIAN